MKPTILLFGLALASCANTNRLAWMNKPLWKYTPPYNLVHAVDSNGETQLIDSAFAVTHGMKLERLERQTDAFFGIPFTHQDTINHDNWAYDFAQHYPEEAGPWLYWQKYNVAVKKDTAYIQSLIDSLNDEKGALAILDYVKGMTSTCLPSAVWSFEYRNYIGDTRPPAPQYTRAELHAMIRRHEQLLAQY